MRGRPGVIWEPGFESLCAAIIRQAIMDYGKSIKYTSEHNSGEVFEAEEICKKECERFFLGAWFSTICDLDGERLLRWIRERAV